MKHVLYQLSYSPKSYKPGLKIRKQPRDERMPDFEHMSLLKQGQSCYHGEGGQTTKGLEACYSSGTGLMGAFRVRLYAPRDVVGAFLLGVRLNCCRGNAGRYSP